MNFCRRRRMKNPLGNVSGIFANPGFDPEVLR
jgi:hypothetical protein